MPVKLKILLAVLIFPLAILAAGQASVQVTHRASSCTAVKWPFSKNVDKLQVKNLQTFPRATLSSFLFYELSNAPDQRTPGLAEKLMFYLVNTELNEGRYYFYLALADSSDLGAPSQKVVPLPEICGLQSKLVRSPTSTWSRKKKINKTASRSTP